MAEHNLALSVINTGSHYDARCMNFVKMTARKYRSYILGLVVAEAHTQRVKFGIKPKTADINIAVDEVLDHMQMHMTEMYDPANAGANHG